MKGALMGGLINAINNGVIIIVAIILSSRKIRVAKHLCDLHGCILMSRQWYC